MSDWQVGDLAVCVDASDFGGGIDARAALVEGRTYRVIGITPPAAWTEGGYSVGLVLYGVRRPWGYNDFHPDRFRKILPDKHEACEEEFVTLLKHTKRKANA